MREDRYSKTKALIIRNFDLKVPDEPLDEGRLFEILADQIAHMIEFQMEYLLSLLYRNDVPEHKINFALSPQCPDPPNIAIAKLVLERQKQRLETRKSIEIKPIEDLDEELRL
ncbi:MAG: hypothetical protein D6714_03185 [Bacteroidetes bacterium]|nr:MAG: hypothetical protein D6714_03185 [Bacteroidota bacterium]